MKISTPPVKLGQWLGYSGMATAFLAVAPKVEAQVISTDLEPDVVLVNDNIDIDFDNDGVVDMNISQSNIDSSSFSLAGAVMSMPSGAVIGQVQGAFIYPSVLASGAPIAPGDLNFQSLSGSATLALKFRVGSSSTFYGNWNEQSGFLGCHFTAGDGAVHYGWVQLAVDTGNTSVTVMAYGYESMPDVAINAGDMDITTGVADARTQAFNMSIAPDPTSDNAEIRFPNTGNGDMRMSLMNSVGRTLFTAEMGNADSYTLDLASYAAGVYFVRLQDGKKVAFRKVTKH